MGHGPRVTFFYQTSGEDIRMQTVKFSYSKLALTMRDWTILACWFNIVATDALAPAVARPSAAMISTILNGIFLLFLVVDLKNLWRISAEKMISYANRYSTFLERIQYIRVMYLRRDLVFCAK